MIFVQAVGRALTVSSDFQLALVFPPTQETAVRDVRPHSKQVRQTYDFGDEGRPLEDQPNLAQSLQPGRSADGGSFEAKRKVGRNDPCPCGSGKKFKKCCARKHR
jgi:uncharacterized protein YecA (UPF0149 family)